MTQTKDPFEVVDNINLKFGNFNFNFFQNYEKIQKVALGFAIVCTGMWIVFGFDSNPTQFIHVLYDDILPGLLHRSFPSMAKMISTYNYYYGKEMHYSAFVIYVLMFYGLSKHFQKIGIVKTKNLCYSFGVMFLAIAIFEFFWMGSFAYFQNQYWTITLAMPQLRIILQDLGFLLLGIPVVLYIYADSFNLKQVWNKGKIDWEITGRKYKLNVGWTSLALIALSIASIYFWIHYPFYVQTFSVTLKNGQIWQSSRLFPQTLYTIKLDPNGSLNAGEWFWIQNDAIHATNTIVKAIMALTVYSFFKVRRVETQ